ncbi:S41 family peptidase [Rheinheimera fenheensis]|uniref:S41 family peptidase n=1 Tax=Rheinheimera fenheensis TaxID=3152295 RepID=UPI0032610B48
MSESQFVRLQWDPVNCADGAAGLIPAFGHIPDWLGQFRLISAKAENIVLQRLSDHTLVKFERSDTLPYNCSHPPIQNNLHQLLSMRFNLMHFGKTPDIANYQRIMTQVQQLDASIADDSEIELRLFDQLLALLASVSDRHAFLYARPLEKFQGFFSPDSAELVLPDQAIQLRQLFCNNEIVATKLAGDLWHIKIHQLLGFTERDGYSPEAEQCITALVRYINGQRYKDGYQLIVDLANNGGGSIQLAAALHAALTGYTGQPFAFIADQVVSADPSIALQTKPKRALVLVNQATASAAEHLALALKHSGFKLAGRTTMGAFSPTMIKTLPNGWFYGFSMYQNIRDQFGQPVPEHIGLTPDCPDPLTDIVQLLSRCG